MTSSIKIVSKSDPNADGKWIDIPVDLRQVRRWKNIEAIVAPHIPPGHVIVAVDCDRGVAKEPVTTFPKAVEGA